MGFIIITSGDRRLDTAHHDQILKRKKPQIYFDEAQGQSKSPRRCFLISFRSSGDIWLKDHLIVFPEYNLKTAE